ncbi:MAG: hypothetical protein A2X46_01665 [Lentisphaerae bacterium GWF2_57_35]|nr:MAG: hypothetical protein A2X46_01665 [Lentisphaerae bacterium GWF2_57_35]
MNILAVDDEAVILTILKYLVEAIGASVTPASNAVDALQYLREHPSDVDLLITDLNMPGMNGFDLLKAVRQLAPALPVIVLTGRDDREAVLQALQLGANDYLDKPVHKTALLQSIERVLQSAPKNYLEQSFNTRREVQEAQQKLMESSNIQRLVEAGVLAFWHRPVSDAGGDFIYGRASPDALRNTIVLVDAAGHDIGSSYYVAECKGLLDALVSSDRAPVELLNGLNEKLVSSAHVRHLCALVLDWDLPRGQIRLANAAIPHGLLFRTDGATIPLRLNGTVLGLLDHPAFDAADIRLAPGDRLLLFTDGVESFGQEERLGEIWRTASRQPLAVALKQLVQTLNFEAPDAAQDDLLLLALEQPLIAGNKTAPEYCRLQIRIHSDRRAIEPAVQQTLDFAHSMMPGHDADLLERIAATLRELVCNAVLHGNREQPDAHTVITLRVGNERAILNVADQGSGFDLEKELAFERTASPLRNGRRGLLTAENYSDELSLTGGEVQAVFRRNDLPTV